MAHHARAIRRHLARRPRSSASDAVAVLNVGFGLGLFDEAVQRELCGEASIGGEASGGTAGEVAARPLQHTIIEAHPDVLRHAEAEGWTVRRGVRLLAARWQEAVATEMAAGRQYDAVFFDTYMESYGELRRFLSHIATKSTCAALLVSRSSHRARSRPSNS